jgi:hypothetical protein
MKHSTKPDVYRSSPLVFSDRNINKDLTPFSEMGNTIIAIDSKCNQESKLSNLLNISAVTVAVENTPLTSDVYLIKYDERKKTFETFRNVKIPIISIDKIEINHTGDIYISNSSVEKIFSFNLIQFNGVSTIVIFN